MCVICLTSPTKADNIVQLGSYMFLFKPLEFSNEQLKIISL